MERVILSPRSDLKRTKAADLSESFWIGPASISKPLCARNSPKWAYSSLLKSTIGIISNCYNSQLPNPPKQYECKHRIVPSGENLRLRLRGNCLKKMTKFDKISFIIEQYY